MVGMARATSTAVLTKWDRKAGGGYRAKVVFAFRSFELNPHDQRNATSILDLMPQNDEQSLIWYSFGDYLDCAAASNDEGRN
jgi:hypothetical protein